MEFQPSKIARLADSSTGSPPIGLGLALGRGGVCGGSGGGLSDDDRHRALAPTSGYTKPSASSCCYGFTVVQLGELQLQSLIYKYIEAGCPVPYNLILPIWKSVSCSLDSTLFQLFPSFMGVSQMQMEYRNGVEAEPGRCRRTDGKKWRCSKEALPDQKYCERHMHRGRPRSRKLVEAASHDQTTSSSSSTNLTISLPVTSNTDLFSLSGFYCNSAHHGPIPRN
ncbi:growth-regulating factor 10-like [Mercurialis annua]|uniref:growth-regulating factor 10-like n=1 Tax=Mercurialis annua TaxID=3986 RepID=UPI0021602BE7|nr:growth-regulating factor 10-like [Mercurialis annua]